MIGDYLIKVIHRKVRLRLNLSKVISLTKDSWITLRNQTAIYRAWRALVKGLSLSASQTPTTTHSYVFPYFLSRDKEEGKLVNSEM